MTFSNITSKYFLIKSGKRLKYRFFPKFILSKKFTKNSAAFSMNPVFIGLQTVFSKKYLEVMSVRFEKIAVMFIGADPEVLAESSP